ncbi:MAG: LPS export ABC transporter permease LptG, partial [Deltaproteobacteria bacterium]|nr:LPS export ABC transporter permease LptG [Deltaproteobacteria bacterium]
MLIITRYFTREFLRIFALCMASFVALYILVDLFERLDDMIKHQVAIGLVIKYFLCSIPMIIYQVCPLGVLLCSFITIGIFVRNQEITALKAHGISLFRVLNVFVVMAFVLCLLSLWLQEYVLPYTNTQVKEIKTFHIKGKKKSRLKKNHNVWYRSEDTVYNFGFFDQDRSLLRDVTILTFDPQFALRSRIDAEKVVWEDGVWKVEQGRLREFDGRGGMRLSRFERQAVSIDKSPLDLQDARKEGEEMSFSEIRAFIKQIRREGYSSTPYEVDLHAKLSYPFISVVMAILGIPFALRTGRHGG